MAILVSELRAWLDSLDEEDEVAVDEGGLTLVVLGRRAYMEVGGVPEDSDGEEDS